MKFSELSAEQWAELQPYLDTAILPVTGLTGAEMPHEATRQLERLRDVLATIEVPFKGRVVTYPALQYGQWSDAFAQQVKQLSLKLRSTGYKYVFLASAIPLPAAEETGADLVVCPTMDNQLPEAGAVNEDVRRIWLGRA
ncbi:DUF2487 family protein [Paenibacillus sacheonensis]|uniref:DUF2487 family protein n=1 Tax=Paenibacillus sacheonensis TaxID=742054 RepID=A0A7X4YP63_9BACL|nr:DUF2487 family protein [Paenibacillus sacheonensis]MBM7564510.1 hypothetical protein [Paenibacillus sacheonensis]NBC69069.1 DUF2487 family protein [Paenibacillus sacheonensis]